MNAQQIREQLDLATEANQNELPEVAIERLANAVAMLLRVVEEDHASMMRTANVASCLANGINPD